jgi:hypothetical protein
MPESMKRPQDETKPLKPKFDPIDTVQNSDSETDTLRKENAALSARLARLESLVELLAEPLPETPNAQGVTPYPVNMAERSAAKLRRFDEELKAQKEVLASGEHQFTVYLSTNPNRRFTVGGVDADHAEARFKKHVGILGFLDTTVRIVAEPIDAVAV